MNNLEKIARACSDEISYTIMRSIKNNANINYHTSSYWINNNYKVVADTTTDWDDKYEKIERQYLSIKLEQYDNKQNCINEELDYQETEDLQESNIYNAVFSLLERNTNYFLGGLSDERIKI